MEHLSLMHLLSFSLGALCATIAAFACLRRWKKGHLFYALPRFEEVHRPDPRLTALVPMPERVHPLCHSERWRGDGGGRKALPPMKTEQKRERVIEAEPLKRLSCSVILLVDRRPERGLGGCPSPGL